MLSQWQAASTCTTILYYLVICGSLLLPAFRILSSCHGASNLLCQLQQLQSQNKSTCSWQHRCVTVDEPCELFDRVPVSASKKCGTASKNAHLPSYSFCTALNLALRLRGFWLLSVSPEQHQGLSEMLKRMNSCSQSTSRRPTLERKSAQTKPRCRLPSALYTDVKTISSGFAGLPHAISQRKADEGLAHNGSWTNAVHFGLYALHCDTQQW